MIELLKPDEWPKLESIFADDWNAELPDPKHGNIIVEIDDDELIGFCMTESLVRVGNFHVSPNHRGNGTVRRLIKYVAQRAPQTGRSFIALADEPRYEKLFKHLGMRQVGMGYRRDF